MKNMNNTGMPVPLAIRIRVRALVDKHGEKEATKMLGLGRTAVARVLAGLGVRRGTALVVQLALEALDAAERRRAEADGRR